MENEQKQMFTKYALVSRQIELNTHTSELIRTDADPKSSKLLAEPGTLIKVFGPLHNENGKCVVQVLDFVQHDFIYENLYECLQNNLTKVSEDLWPYVISISRPEHRLRLVNNKDQCRWLVHLKPNDLLSVKGELFRKDGSCFDCIVRYIGPVQELQSVGYFFGLELLHLDNGRSPQSEDIPFAIKYMQCEPSLAIFTTADWITPISNEVKKKLSARQLINETIERVCTAIAPTTGIAQNQRRDKKPKAKQATAQFYDAPMAANKELAMDAAKPLEETADNRLNLDNEEFGMSVENYDLSVERKHASTIQSSPQKVTNKSGILKHNKSQTLNGNKDVKDANLSTIMSLGDRDIVVIDKADIKESTKNENNVIVLDNPPPHKDVDLADLLGSNWPLHAGGAATILNRSQTSSESAPKIDNKSERFIQPTSSTQTPQTAVEKHYLVDAGPEIISASADKSNINIPESQQLVEVPGTKLTIGSLVEISDSDLSGDLYGVIRWIGIPAGSFDVLVGIELEDAPNLKNRSTSDGSYNGLRLFQCHEGRAIFVSPNKVNIDRRFIDVDGSIAGSKVANDPNAAMFGHVDCPIVSGAIAPLTVHNSEELEDICGKFKGIQGHHNSCYLDATLFSMFTFTSVFDSLLYRLADSQDIPHYSEVQKVLREEIVNPLRQNVFVRADRVMKLRKLLDQLSSVSGLTSEEKDPEEFLNSLLAQIMRVEPFLKLSSGQDSYFYQLFVEKDEKLILPTVQQLFEQSFHSSDIKLKEVPSCLIIQMPRFGKNYKMYPRILPSQVLDVTDIIEDSPRQCSVCGKLAEFECRECFGSLHGGSGLECTAFCQKCLNTVHMHVKRTNHVSKKLSVPRDFKIMAEHMVVPRLYMELFAVVCIETSHYVAFVKSGSGPDAPWCFFDSMADRKGEKNGYNIPEMISVRELPQWLSDEGARVVNETSTNDKILPEHAKRLFCDAYMCMYQSTDVMMYH